MKSIVLSIFILSFFTVSAQYKTPPNYSTEAELKSSPEPVQGVITGITDPPDFDVRPMAEWEEIQSLIITWSGFNHINKNIARYAKEECEVIILSNDVSGTENYLTSNEAGGPLNNMDNITIIFANYNSIWGRDYGGNTCYSNDIESPILVDWIYNRVRPNDDVTPAIIAEYKGIDLYETTVSPYDLMATGGNFMSDGYRTAFSSNLILNENQGGFANGLSHPDHTEAEVNDILNQFMGVENYIKMDVLPYDLIHHIDMHMKIIDEETIIIGEYPEGVADGPQIEANIDYIIANHSNSFGNPFKIKRILQPPEGGNFPNTGGAYRTYSNMVFVNKTVILPVYENSFDDQALETLQDILPGYNIETIECNDIIQLSGAIHCITKAVGVEDPLWIAHDPADDTYIEFEDKTIAAIVKHNSGISEVNLYWKSGIDEAYGMIPMTLANEETSTYEAVIPGQEFGSTAYYYIEGIASNGKTIRRPMPAPAGYFSYDFIGAVGIGEVSFDLLESIYPNPASAITVIPVHLPKSAEVNLYMTNAVGQEVSVIAQGKLSQGIHKLFMDASNFTAGVYNVILEVEGHRYNQRLVIL